MKIGLQLALLVVIAAIGPAIITSAVTYQRSKVELQASLVETEIAVGSALAGETGAFLNSLVTEVKAATAGPAFFRTIPNATEQAIILNVLVARNDAIFALTSMDLDGNEVSHGSMVSGSPTLAENRADSAAFQAALLGATVLEPPHQDGRTREVFLTVWIPVELYEGEVRSVLRVTARIANLLERVTSHAPAGGGYAFVVDGEGRILAHPDRGAIARQTTTLATDLGELANSISAGAVMSEDADMGPVILSHHRVASTDWSIVTVRPTSAVLAPLTEQARFVFTIILVTVAVAAVAALVVARQLVRPLRDLDQAAARLARGDLETPIGIESGGEVGNFAATFEGMRRELRGLYADLEGKVAERTSELREARREVGALNDLLTHDISNYVQPAEVYLRQLSTDESLNEKQKRKVDVSLRNVERIWTLVGNVRELAAMEDPDAPRREVALAQRDVVELVRDAAARTQDTYAGAEGLGIRIVAPDAPCLVGANPILVDVFLNLLTNAVKYSQVPEIEVEIGRSAKDATRWRIAVKDHGLGIPDASKEAIFERFRRLHKPIRGESTGLGLAIARRICQLHGGSLHVEDRVPGDCSQGSVFVVELPIPTSPAAPAPSAQPAALKADP